jgi:hypothetical protein
MATVSFSKSGRKAGARFTQANKGTKVRIARDGGAGKIGPSHCTSTRQHFAKAYSRSRGY